jgi:hypothetical protein
MGLHVYKICVSVLESFQHESTKLFFRFPLISLRSLKTRLNHKWHKNTNSCLVTLEVWPCPSCFCGLCGN